MTRPTEQQVRSGVALGQWGTSWLIAIALVVVILKLPVDPVLVSVMGWIFGITSTGFLVAGMVLCWRLTDGRKWLALIANLFLVLCGVGLFYFMVQKDREATAVLAMDQLHRSTAWLEASSELAQAKDTRAMWKARADGLDPTWVSAAQKPAEEYDKADQKVTSLRQELARMEEKIPVAPVGGSVAFDVFGKENADALMGWILFILAFANEVLALANMWQPKTKKAAVEAKRGATEVRSTVQATESVEKPEIGVHEYVAAAKALSLKGQLCGYRQVMEVLQISDRKARALLSAAIDQGMMTPKTGRAGPVMA